MKKISKIFLTLISILVFAALTVAININLQMPSAFFSVQKSEIQFNSHLPMKIKPRLKTKKTIETLNSSEQKYVDSYAADITLFNIPVKPVIVNIVKRKLVVPSGDLFGIKIFTDGVVVVKTGPVETENGDAFPANEAKIHKNDVIKEIEGQKINSNEDLASIIEKSDGKKLEAKIVRGNLIFDTFIKPVKSVGEKIFRAGIWVRDSSSGIGTITFLDPATKFFGGLGHGIKGDNELLPLSHGKIMKTSIKKIIKSRENNIGELRGNFVGEPIGELISNTEHGVYGILNDIPEETNEKSIPVAFKQEIKIGDAKIISTIEDGKPREYSIKITSINFNKNDLTKNITISLTDEKLIEKTGGIVQGMSGSPVIQNGLLVGAITNVFINNPKSGYAISAETMYENNKVVS
ncbi:MAG: SpoIVB peptidase [Oscillospiraceae bacterium]|nr:SpoIVB peptidase [Oscillospiraceae bacterium]